MAAGSTYTPIANTTGSGSGSVTFSSIPSTYTDLVLVMNGTASSATNIYVRVNGDTGTNYSSRNLYGDGTSAASTSNANYASFQSFAGFYDSTPVGTTIMQFMNYANTNTNKTVLCRYNLTTNMTELAVGLWRSTSAINSITILTSNAATIPSSTTFTLYGIQAA